MTSEARDVRAVVPGAAARRCTCMKMLREHRDEGLRENQDGQAVETLWAVSPLL